MPRTYEDGTPRTGTPGTDTEGFRRTPTDGTGTTPPRSSSPPIGGFDPGRSFDAPSPRGTTPGTPPADDGLFNPPPTGPGAGSPRPSGTFPGGGTTPGTTTPPGGTFDGPTDTFKPPADPLETPVRPRTSTTPGTPPAATKPTTPSADDPFELAPPKGTGTGGLTVPATDAVAVETLDLDERVTSRSEPLRTRVAIRGQFGSPIVQRLRSGSNAGWTAVASPSPGRPAVAADLHLVKN